MKILLNKQNKMNHQKKKNKKVLRLKICKILIFENTQVGNTFIALCGLVEGQSTTYLNTFKQNLHNTELQQYPIIRIPNLLKKKIRAADGT